ncbi:hypothetical protein FISHEDRAFT_67801 [Fistulina hepatica ATCC 64428]|nr:hypothetical protein FISHEDRAFT_67801 [Fistulina hepatica ATCC 64428]
MASPTSTINVDEKPHLVSLVLQSKKALQHGEQQCKHASEISVASSQAVVDVLALDAKIQWIKEGVLAQIQLAASVAKTIAEKRRALIAEVEDWDVSRAERFRSLEALLHSLETQLVPPEFYETSEASSIFGSQLPDDEERSSAPARQQSPSDTVRNVRDADRRRWKNLRDFVHDHAIEELLDTMENERLELDDVMHRTLDYPETLADAIRNIEHDLPAVTDGREESLTTCIANQISEQDRLKTTMAKQLESLALHYDQMAGALRDSEAGDEFGEEELQAMQRDTNELPAIMAELDESLEQMKSLHKHLLSAQQTRTERARQLDVVLDDLEELGDIMSEMLDTQGGVEVDCRARLAVLQGHLVVVKQLYEKFQSYKHSFNMLVLEIARRRQYRATAENIVRGMIQQLDAMTEEEIRTREQFNNEHGAHIPVDICLCMGTPPTKWEITPHQGIVGDVLPYIAPDIITKVSYITL